MARALVLLLLIFSFSLAATPNESYAKIKSPFIKTNGSEEVVKNFNNSKNVWKKNRGKKPKEFSRSDVDEMRTQGDQITKSVNKKNRTKKKTKRYQRGRSAPSSSASAGVNN